MTNTKFKQACKELGWKYQEASEALGKSIPSIKLYATTGKIPKTVEKKIEAILADKNKDQPELAGDVTLGGPIPGTKPLELQVSDLQLENEDLKGQIAALKNQIATMQREKYAWPPTVPDPTCDMSKIKRNPPKSSLKGSFK